VQADLSFLFRPPDKKRFDIQPGIFKKPANILKEKNNSESTSDDHLDKITTASGVNVE
jgi:hypothetical protein